MGKAEKADLRWFKSSRSSGQGGNCVEVAKASDTWYVRDSKNPTGGMLSVAPEAWRAFLDVVPSLSP
jgi:hypothetical protein